MLWVLPAALVSRTLVYFFISMKATWPYNFEFNRVPISPIVASSMLNYSNRNRRLAKNSNDLSNVYFATDWGRRFPCCCRRKVLSLKISAGFRPEQYWMSITLVRSSCWSQCIVHLVLRHQCLAHVTKDRKESKPITQQGHPMMTNKHLILKQENKMLDLKKIGINFLEPKIAVSWFKRLLWSCQQRIKFLAVDLHLLKSFRPFCDRSDWNKQRKAWEIIVE